MKKFLSILLLVFTLGVVACTGQSVSNNVNVEKNGKEVKIVTTIFPIYDIIRELSDDITGVNTRLLMDNGVDLHNYSPKSKDIIDIGNSDLFVYVGGESDEWVKDVFFSIKYDESKAINFMDELTENLKEEELKEGMEAEKEGEEDGEEGVEYDEHIWLSLKNAKSMTKVVYTKLKEILSEKGYDTNAIDKLTKNYDKYTEELDVLDKKYAEVMDTARKNGKEMTMVFADRFPFKYLVSDYNIDYFAAFKGCSAESEASFKTIMFLADKCKELNLNYVFILDSSDGKIAETVIESIKDKKVDILVLDSLQSKTSKDVENGVRYLDVMKQNLDVIKKYFK